MKNIEHAAIVLLGMGEAQAAKVLKYMDRDDVEQIVAAMNRVKSIDDSTADNVLEHFFAVCDHSTGIGVKSSDYIRTTLVDALGNEHAKSLLDKSHISDQGIGLAYLKWENVQTIVEHIKDEHPQIIAIIMTYLSSEQAAKALKLLKEEIRIDVLKRVAKIGFVSPVALDELNNVMKDLFSQSTNFKELATEGTKTVAEIVNHFDSDDEDKVMGALEEVDEALREKVQDLMFPFTSLANIDPRSLQKLLRDVPNEQLMLALKAADEYVRDKFTKNMSERAAAMLLDDMEAMGPVQLSKVEGAQKEIVKLAQELAGKGEIVIGGSGEEMV